MSEKRIGMWSENSIGIVILTKDEPEDRQLNLYIAKWNTHYQSIPEAHVNNQFKEWLKREDTNG